MKWYEFEYNKPYHHMNNTQRLKYEHETDIIEKINYNYDYINKYILKLKKCDEDKIEVVVWNTELE